MPFPILAAVGVGAATSIIGGLIGSGQAKRQAREARAEQLRQARAIQKLKNSRGKITDPFAGITDLSGLATDLTSQMSNPYANLGVATQAAEIQMEQTDMALANTLDTLAATGASAGGATALAQAALASKKGVAASIEQQEAQNEKMRAQGQQQLERMQLAEGQRVQGVQLAEGRRVQQADAQGRAFMFNAKERRETDKIDYVRGQKDLAKRRELGAAQAKANAISNTWSSVGQIGDSVAGAFGNPGSKLAKLAGS